jgi:hypothetical protein
MQKRRIVFVFVLLIAALATTTVSAYEPPENSAAERFKQIRAEKGFDAALAELKAMAAAPEGTWFIDERELRYAAMEMQWEENFAGCIEMMEYLTGVFPDSPVMWYVLGDAYLIEANGDNARRCLNMAREIAPDFPEPKNMLDKLDKYLAVAEVQVAARGKWAPGKNTGLKGAFMGFETPGETPEVFAPGVVSSSSNEFSICFAPDGKEIYFSKSGIGIMRCHETDEGWTAPELVRFFDQPQANDEPHLYPDGRYILFNSRPSIFDERVIYRAAREGDGWGIPEKLFPGMYASATRDGVIFCTVTTERSDYGAIGRYEPLGDEYGEYEVVGGGVNSKKPDAHPFIAPDESFIIFDSARVEDYKIYICFRDEEGNWGEAFSLNERLNIPYACGQATMSPDLKYLFFCEHADIWWVDAGAAIRELRSK